MFSSSENNTRISSRIFSIGMKTGIPSEPCFGVKTSPQLINLDEFDIIEGFVPENLHMLSGIGKQFANV